MHSQVCTGIFFWFLQLGYTCIKPLRWKGWFTKDRLWCADLDYSRIWGSVRSFLYIFQVQGRTAGPKCLLPVWWSSPWRPAIGSQPTLARQHLRPGHTLIWLTLSLIGGLVVLALCPLGRACICCLTTEFSIRCFYDRPHLACLIIQGIFKEL